LLKAKCEEAARLQEFCDPRGKWAWKDSYVFVYDLTGKIIAHSNPPTLVGKNLIGLKDIKGNMFAAEFVSIAKSEKGKGWSEYWWPKAQAQEASLKVSYIVRVPGKDWFVGAGIYDVSKAEAIGITGE
jgi:signal transduction histidine kinase